MRIDRRSTWAAVSLALILGLGGCAGGGTTTTTAPVAVTDVASVAGKWVGLLSITGSRDREDYVEVTVDRSGAYRASAARTIGVLDVKGTVTVSGGRLLIKGDSGGQGTAILYTQPPPDQHMLVVNGTASDGRAYTLRLRPQH
jgi:Zn-dependent alcohol dehydrogenase